MASRKIIGQIIVDNISQADKNLLPDNEKIIQLGVYTLPGCEIIIDNCPIIVSGTGILQIDSIADNIAIKSISISMSTIKKLIEAKTKMVIDYISYNTDGTIIYDLPVWEKI